MKVVEWNVHKMTNNIPVKKFVISKLIEIDADVICLVEYLTDNGIEKSLKEQYWFMESNTSSGNKVFIAVKKEFAPGGIFLKNKNEVRGCYNFLHIDFITKSGISISIIGVRMLSPMNAAKQTLPLKKYLSGLKNLSFLCIGDFNIQYYRINKWFPNIATQKMIGSTAKLSDVSIIYTDKNFEITGYGAVDHILHSDNLSVNSEYNWDYLSCDSSYPNINNVSIGTIWNIKPSFPDHALMISHVEII